MRLFVALVLLCAGLAGCLQDDAVDEVEPNEGRRDRPYTPPNKDLGTEASTKNNTTQNEPSPNRPPVAMLSIAPGNNSTGPVPFNTSFFLNGTDADGDTLHWKLEFRDGSNTTVGHGLPQVVTHNFTRAGIYNVTLSVNDGEAVAQRVLRVHVFEPATGGFEPVSESQLVVGPCPLCSSPPIYHRGCASLEAQVGGGDCVWFEVPAEAGGRPFEAGSNRGDPDSVFTDGCSTDAAVVEPAISGGSESGTVPVGARCFVVWEFSLPASTIVFNIR